jgi:hypothetical protein
MNLVEFVLWLLYTVCLCFAFVRREHKYKWEILQLKHHIRELELNLKLFMRHDD